MRVGLQVTGTVGTVMLTNAKRRWIRFSLRALLLAVTLVACAGGWTAYQLNWIRERRAVLARNDVYRPYPVEYWLSVPSHDSPPWPLGWFGAEAAGTPTLGLPLTTSDAELERIQLLFPETEVVRAQPR